MKYTGLFGVFACCICLTLGTDAAASNRARAPIRLSGGPHLFIDDFLIAQSNGLVRTAHQPEKVPQPVLRKAESWHQQTGALKVLYDPDMNRYRMWYQVKNPGATPYLCYAHAESRDGVKWDRPHLNLVEAAGSKNNNLIVAPMGYFGLFLEDEGPGCVDPSRRYKLGYYHDGLCLAFSADGFTFKEYKDNPVIHHSADGTPDGKPGYKNAISDVLDGCWDPLQKRYLLLAKLWDTGYPGKPHHAPMGMRRTVAVTTSKDFVNWETPRQVLKPDPNNGLEEFYSIKPMVRGNQYIGFLRVLRDDLPADEGGAVEGIGWTELVTSRDGEHWTRRQDMFLDRDHKSGSWDHGIVFVGECITVGDKDYIYYGGCSAGHKVGDRATGMAMLRKNGFVSYNAGPKESFLRTPQVLVSGKSMTVNADVKGELRVRLLDASGKPLGGFDFDDCRPMQGDSLAHKVNWKGNLATLTDKPIQIEFLLRNARLFAFDLTE